jgi:DNA-binding protein H-NS
MAPCVSHYLTVKENIRHKCHNKSKLVEVKKGCKAKVHKKLREEEGEAKQKHTEREGTVAAYKTGLNMEDGGADGYTFEELLATARAVPKKKKKSSSGKDVVCPLCKKKGHSTARSSFCLHYKGPNPRNKKVAAVVSAATKETGQAPAGAMPIAPALAPCERTPAELGFANAMQVLYETTINDPEDVSMEEEQEFIRSYSSDDGKEHDNSKDSESEEDAEALKRGSI